LLQMSAEAKQQGKQLADSVAMVLTDLEMPEMDGFTLTRNIKADDFMKAIPVVIHSSLSGAANEDHVKMSGPMHMSRSLWPKNWRRQSARCWSSSSRIVGCFKVVPCAQ